MERNRARPLLRRPQELLVAKRTSGKRELVDTGNAKMFGKRGARGRFKEMDVVGRSLTSDGRRQAKTSSKPGYGDQGDRTR
jgi:hypothetical protein